eukprot:gnl/TRDRNA2_/TRDRNA2_121916_c1_seq1.p1 gnl/TRDRNA2_/TRDRNA2_121916_c1~~gnl/TRDRNA2_/TRDRNA2_121916_c1_seq1.p1  ORF type:complete len:558 (-),score=75.97 gnl/TRDRNA2_/TRDRNA2_121916_c1_seq1:187-1653(-)
MSPSGLNSDDLSSKGVVSGDASPSDDRRISKDGIYPADGASANRIRGRLRYGNAIPFTPTAASSAAPGAHDDSRPVFVFEVDDEADEDLLAAVDDPLVPDPMSLCTVECPPGAAQVFKGRGDQNDACCVVYSVRRVDLFEELGLDRVVTGSMSTRVTSQLTRRLAEVLNEMYACVLFRQLVHHGGGGGHSPASCLAALSWRIAVLEDDVIELVLTGQMLTARTAPSAPGSDCSEKFPNMKLLVPQGIVPAVPLTMKKKLSSRVLGQSRVPAVRDRLLRADAALVHHTLYLHQSPLAESVVRPLQSRNDSTKLSQGSAPTPEATQDAVQLETAASTEPTSPNLPEQDYDRFGVGTDVVDPTSVALASNISPVSIDSPARDGLPSFVLVSALSSVPYCQVERYCGLVTVHMIKETVNVSRHFESLQVFYHQFVAEALLTAKAHVLAVGGNVLLGYRINNLFLREDKRRAYAVISISGDAAKLSSSSPSSS